MNRRSLLLGALAASACGAGSLPAAAVPRGPQDASYALLREFWAIARARWADLHAGRPALNADVLADFVAFFRRNQLTLPVRFAVDHDGGGKSFLTLHETIVRRDELGRSTLYAVVSSETMTFPGQQPGAPHFEPINWEFPRA